MTCGQWKQWKSNTDISLSFYFDKLVQTVLCLNIQRLLSVIINNSELCFCLFLAVFGLHQLPRETSGSLAAKCSTTAAH